MFGIIILIILIIAIYALLNDNKGDNCVQELIDKVKKGDSDISTKDPDIDYINMRQMYNINGELTKEDIEELKIEVV